MLVFLGIEVMSVAVYVLVAINRRSARSAEGALKYFLLGAFSTAFLLYGMALVYGATGETNFARCAAAAARRVAPRARCSRSGSRCSSSASASRSPPRRSTCGRPDAYDGAPTPHTAFMAATVKAAAFAAFLRCSSRRSPAATRTWHPVDLVAAPCTMIVGNVTALAQRNVKRLLAYSSIAHAGYLLIAVVVGAGRRPDTAA
jgi:NADH-quinone oxidoreductase subunit N